MEQNEKLTREQKLCSLGYMIELVAAAVKEEQPPEPTDKVDFEFVYKTCKYHDIANTAFYAVEKLKNKPDDDLYKKWRDARNMGVHRFMIQTMEAQALREAFIENKIDFMPVKGFPICELYPEPNYRYMGDLDYLLRYDDLKKAGAIVKNMGYMPDEVGKFHHDEYKKPPLMVIELHHSMVRRTSKFSKYYEGVLDRCQKISEHEYKMSDEDFYIFQIVHLNKHYEDSGSGVRSFLDIYLLNKKTLPRLNREYIDAELKKLELTDFVKFVEKIVDKWFERSDVQTFSKDEIYIFTSGVYGSDAHKYQNSRGDLNTGAFLVKRIFPPVNWMRDTYPILGKSMFFLPFTYVHRLFRGLTKKRGNVKNEITSLKK